MTTLTQQHEEQSTQQTPERPLEEIEQELIDRVEVQFDRKYTNEGERSDEFYKAHYDTAQAFLDWLARQIEQLPHLPRIGETLSDEAGQLYVVTRLWHNFEPDRSDVTLWIGTHEAPIEEGSAPTAGESEGVRHQQAAHDLVDAAERYYYVEDAGAYTYENPRLVLKYHERWAKMSDIYPRDEQGHITYKCELTEEPFALPEGAPCPLLVYEWRDKNGELIHDDDEHYTCIHPRLASQGEEAIKEAIKRHVHESLSEACDQITVAAEYESLLDQPIRIDWPDYGAEND